MGGLHVDVELEARGLLDGNIGGVRPFDDLVNLRGSRTSHCKPIGVEAHQSAGHDSLPERVARRKTGGERQIGDLLAEVEGQGGTGRHHGLRPIFFHTSKRRFKVVGRFDADRQKRDTELASRQVLQRLLDECRIIDRAKDSYAFEVRYNFLEDLQSLPIRLRRGFEGYAGHVPAGMREALDEPELHRETDRYEYR